jgi:hypothetical protein
MRFQRKGKVIPCGEEPETHLGWRVVYLVVGLDVELNLLAGECSDPVWTGNVSLWLWVTLSKYGVMRRYNGDGVVLELRNVLDQHIETVSFSVWK